MKSVQRRPGPGLAPFIRSIGYYEMDGPDGRERMLPSGEAQLLVNLHEDQLRTYDGDLPRAIGGAALQGPHASHLVIDTAEQRSVVGVSFRPGGAYPFLAPPVSEVAGSFVATEALWGRAGAVLRERLLEADSPPARLRILESALVEVAVRSLEPDPGIRFAAAELGRGTPVAEVTERLGMTPKQFIRRFSAQVGLTPKRYARVRRFQRALSMVPYDHPTDWSEIAATSGYFDQSHLIHDFRAFAGISPGAYRPRSPAQPNHLPLT